MWSYGSGTPGSSVVSTGWHQIESLLIRALERALVWHQRIIERRQLARLSEFELHDIGLSRSDVAGEIDKPFWRA